MAGAQKKAQREGRLIVFVDESGISERPTRVRTWALKGQTPIIQFHFNWNHVSVIAGLSRNNFLFRLHEGSIKKEEIVEFLKALKTHLKQPLLVIWDGLKAHRSRWVREYLDSLNGHIQIAFLPPYAPDMNPVEYLWAWLKRHALANYCPNNLSELHTMARNKLKSAQKRPSIIAACWMQLPFGDVMSYGSLNRPLAHYCDKIIFKMVTPSSGRLIDMSSIPPVRWLCTSDR